MFFYFKKKKKKKNKGGNGTQRNYCAIPKSKRKFGLNKEEFSTLINSIELNHNILKIKDIIVY